MDIFDTLVFFLSILYTFIDAQRVAPGVAPQRYQTSQQEPQLQYEQYQQVPIQQQAPVHQVPVQHQVPVRQHHQPHHHDHGHQQILNSANVAEEAQHISEHLDVPMDTSKMTGEELQFHYFRMHDADNNGKLDGCELVKYLLHFQNENQAGPMTDEQLSEAVDPLLRDIDVNRDGFISYIEYKNSIK